MSGKTYTIPQFEEALKRLGKEVRGKVLGRAAIAGGYVIEAAAKINVGNTFNPNSGNLAGSINTELVKTTDQNAEVAVGPSVIYGRIHELGGTVKPVLAKMLRWKDKDGNWYSAMSVTLPARPYLRPAVDNNEEKIMKAVAENLRIEIEGAI
jgi:phage gpG-like protein